ncbi:MAG TPA: nuclear transport factor 2 family protein [Phycisphaerae bacterium]|nr:nuclear transport factor 2 family protein [Phycisphaerae bacterium]
MSLETIARKFVELCRQKKNFDVMETMYAPDIVSVEGDGKETIGKGPVIEKSRHWATVNTFHGETVSGPFFSGGTDSQGQFAVYFTLDITRNSTGERMTLEEVGLYTVKNDKITREQFFYDGDH